MTNKLMTHMVCGYPTLEESQSIFDILKEKSEYIEIQFPFSDPIADGPVIEKANEIALENGINTEKCFDFAEKNVGGNTKILIMTYYNIVLNYGVENFVKKAKEIGVFGFIIPDVPFDEEDGKIFRELCQKYNIVFTEIVSPITTEKRLEEIKNLNPKLIYAISQNMTTGSKAKFGENFEKYINNLKNIFSCPVGVGFGVKTREDIVQINNISDFAIIGSEFIKKYALKEVLLGDNNGATDKLKEYLEEIK